MQLQPCTLWSKTFWLEFGAHFVYLKWKWNFTWQRSCLQWFIYSYIFENVCVNPSLTSVRCAPKPSRYKRSYRISVDTGRSPINIHTSSMVEIKAARHWPGTATSSSRAFMVPDVEMLSLWLFAGTSSYLWMMCSGRGQNLHRGAALFGLLVALWGVYQRNCAPVTFLSAVPMFCFWEDFDFIENAVFKMNVLSCICSLKAQNVKFK